MALAELRTRVETFKRNARTAGEIATHVVKHPDMIISWGKKPFAASIDVTPNCNLRCQHCYLYGKEYQEEGVSNESFLTRVKEFREQYPGIAQCTWVGGEPMIRKKLLREAVKLFPVNWIVTNGTVPIDGEWKNTAFFISIDGNEETHNQIRQTWKENLSGYNVYNRAKETAKNATAPVHVHTTINQLNKDSIPGLVAEWKADTPARGFAFSTHTPQVDTSRPSGMTAIDESLFLSPEDRTQMVNMLLELKKQHGDFIMMSEEQIKLLLPERQQEAYGANCPLVKGVVSVDSKFDRKHPCVMGEGMDCNKCGCVIPTMVKRWQELDAKSIKLSLKTVFK